MKFIHLLAFIPFVGMLGGLFFVNKVEPYVLGLPFLVFWIVLWVILTSFIMAIIYKLDSNKGDI
ncbi:DUF3311 domain-containing protein [Bacillus sp. MUM 13]|uniref:DUF3311 domain-containing protein n=1 Tax=Bacillus sp. MUM 13 TaxID=1678001 RepID=UPI0008F585E4|nr:DUF3311 domain-containing protein [Bacillus sp. MUM 13]OIK03637.1 hypothetical protein BIV59_22455 [Bacillus sp. MUM 13]